MLFLSEGTVSKVENAEFTVGDTVMTCRDGDTLSRYITKVEHCIVDPAKDVSDETMRLPHRQLAAAVYLSIMKLLLMILRKG